MTSLMNRRAKRVRIYVNESDQSGAIATPVRLVEFLRKHNAAGATVVRCGMGFGESGRIHTVQVVDLAADLPVIVEWIDQEQRVEELLPELVKMVKPGLVTVEDTTIRLCASQPVRDVSSELAVAAVMTRDPVHVSSSTAVREVVARMNEHGLRAVPVVDAGVPVGMITSCDLINRAGLAAGMSRLPGIQPSVPPHHGDGSTHLVARGIMTSPVVVVPTALPLSQAADTMVRRKLKRLPVVDEHGIMVGIVSRVDLLRTVAHFPDREHGPEAETFANPGIELGQIMRRDVPTVFPHTRIPEVLQVLVSTRLNLALVVDADKKLVGLITAAELLQRITPALRPSILTALTHRMPFFRASPEEAESERHAGARAASELMTDKYEKAYASTPLNQVIATMVGGSHKIIAVVDDEDRLMGIVDRADVLRGLLHSAAQ